jgi:hypothetical protein
VRVSLVRVITELTKLRFARWETRCFGLSIPGREVSLVRSRAAEADTSAVLCADFGSSVRAFTGAKAAA